MLVRPLGTNSEMVKPKMKSNARVKTEMARRLDISEWVLYSGRVHPDSPKS